MAINITTLTSNIESLSSALNNNVFIGQARASFTEKINDFQISDEERAKLIAQYEANLSVGIINNILAKSVDIIELDLRVNLIQEQINTETINQGIKDQQELAEKLKNGQIYYEYTYFEATDQEVIDGLKNVGDIKTKDIGTGLAKSLYEVQIEKLIQELNENTEKWNLQKQIVANQVTMSNVDASKKETLAQKDIDIKDKQIVQMQADIDFNTSKKTIMEQTRKDNIRMKSAEMFAEFLKYLSAANVIPATGDFGNIRALIVAIQQGIANDNATADISSPIGNQYVKP
jgi:hypothetical protein